MPVRLSVKISTTNLNVFETIPEEPVAEPDKYENSNDPVVLWKARDTAKAKPPHHTRSIRAINEKNLNDCPSETLEKLRLQLARTFDIVTKRHTHFLEHMSSPDEIQLEDEQAWL